MKKFLAVLAALTIILTMSGCSAVVDGLRNGVHKIIDNVDPEKITERIVSLSGEVTEKTVYPADGKEITSVVLDGLSFSFKDDGEAYIKIIPSDKNCVVLKYQSDLDDYGFYAAAEDGEIRLSAEKATQFRTSDFEAVVYANCDSIRITGGIELFMEGCAKDSLTLDITGGIDAEMTGIDIDTLDITVNGAADFDISGTANKLSAVFNGAGELDAKEFICKEAFVTVNGAGNAEISCTEKLEANINGAGGLEYYGSPSVNVGGASAKTVTQKSPSVYGK